MKIAVIFGTRPEAIKLAPIVREIERRGRKPLVIVTAQHRHLLDQELRLFELQPDYDLNIMTEDQSMFDVTVNVLTKLGAIFQKDRPDVVLLQGDTTTTMATSLAAFYHRIAVGHVESGLRTWNKYNPYPEEINRQLTTRIADLHFAPTEWSRANLQKEGVPPKNIFVVGNTVVDALLWVLKHQKQEDIPELKGLNFKGQKMILVTAHRRESFGKPLENICQACTQLVDTFDDVVLVYPVHPNPNVRKTVFGHLKENSRIHLIEPVDYPAFVHLMHECHLILTDSGGIQEEAPSLGKPVLVLRETTERPEAVEAGTAKLVGTDPEAIVRETATLLTNAEAYRAMTAEANPFGDGTAATKIVDILLTHQM